MPNTTTCGAACASQKNALRHQLNEAEAAAEQAAQRARQSRHEAVEAAAQTAKQATERARADNKLLEKKLAAVEADSSAEYQRHREEEASQHARQTRQERNAEDEIAQLKQTLKAAELSAERLAVAQTSPAEEAVLVVWKQQAEDERQRAQQAAQRTKEAQQETEAAEAATEAANQACLRQKLFADRTLFEKQVLEKKLAVVEADGNAQYSVQLEQSFAARQEAEEARQSADDEIVLLKQKLEAAELEMIQSGRELEAASSGPQGQSNLQTQLARIEKELADAQAQVAAGEAQLVAEQQKAGAQKSYAFTAIKVATTQQQKLKQELGDKTAEVEQYKVLH